MVSPQRDLKTTWELAGRLAGSFETSTQKAKTRLGQLRAEYRASQTELRYLQNTLKTAERGTIAYANASERIPALQESLANQGIEIADLNREIATGTEAQGKMASASDRAAGALRGVASFGLAAGAAVGIAAGAVTLLAKSLGESAKEAQALQVLSIRGIDPTSYQRASNTLRVLSGDADTAKRGVASIAELGQRVREALAFDPRTLDVGFRRGAAALGFPTLQELDRMTQDVDGFFEHVRRQVAAAEGDATAINRIYGAAGAVGLDRAVIDHAREYNQLLQTQAELRELANLGDANAAKELAAINRRINAVRTEAGIISESDQALLVKYSEAVENLKLAGRDLKIAFTTSFADDMIAAAKMLTQFVKDASELWDKINTPGDERPEGGYNFAEEPIPATVDAGRSVRDFMEQLNTDVDNWFNRNVNQRLGIPAYDREQRTDFVEGPKLVYSELKRLNDSVVGFFSRNVNQRLGIPQFAQGGTVPGAAGDPVLALVHGGERVVSLREREMIERTVQRQQMQMRDRELVDRLRIERAVAPAEQAAINQTTSHNETNYDQSQRRDQRVIRQENAFHIYGGAAGIETGEEVAEVLARQLATGIRW